MMKYHSDFTKVKVNNSCLIQYNGAKYGVPKEYYNKTVLLDKSNDLISIYDFELNKIASYPIYTSGIHYSEGLYDICALKGESKEAYDKRIASNLALLAGVGKATKEVNKNA